MKYAYVGAPNTRLLEGEDEYRTLRLTDEIGLNIGEDRMILP